MVTVEQIINRQKKYTYYLLALLVLGWGFTPYPSLFLGLIVGAIISFLCIRLVARRTEKLMETVLAHGEKVPARQKILGTYSRLATFGLVALIAVRYPHAISGWGIGIGLMTGYFVIIIDYVYHIFVARKRGE